MRLILLLSRRLSTTLALFATALLVNDVTCFVPYSASRKRPFRSDDKVAWNTPMRRRHHADLISVLSPKQKRQTMTSVRGQARRWSATKGPHGVSDIGRPSSCNDSTSSPSALRTTPSAAQSQKRRNLLLLSSLFLSVPILSAKSPNANSAPPIAIIAEELGYFPITKNGETVYVPKRVQRESSQQAIELAKHLQKSGVVMYGAYWCPHCARQKELFGREAWQLIHYVECDGRGYNGDAKLCSSNDIDGFPTWKSKGEMLLSGEVPLSALARASNYPKAFREDLEANVPPMIGSKGACQ